MVGDESRGDAAGEWRAVHNPVRRSRSGGTVVVVARVEVVHVKAGRDTHRKSEGAGLLGASGTAAAERRRVGRAAVCLSCL